MTAACRASRGAAPLLAPLLACAPLPALAAQSTEEQSARELLAELGLGRDAVVADVGAGDGALAASFVQILREGHVYFQDLREHHAVTWESRVRPWPERATFVTGTETDPGLPEEAIDLVVVRDALHEFTQPHPMLAGIGAALRPGGQLVVVDRYKGPVRERVPFAEREDEHAFNGELTTARLAFDAGLVYVGHTQNTLAGSPSSYAMVFARPAEDGPALSPLDPAAFALELPATGRVALAAHDPSRAAAIAFLERALPPGVEVVELDLDEWRYPGQPTAAPETQRPWTMVRTFHGVPEIELGELDALLFVDAFHALYHEDVLLGFLHRALKRGAPVYVLDRAEREGLPRLEYHHRRGIPPALVARTLARNGFACGPLAAGDGPTQLVVALAAEPATPASILSVEAWRALLADVDPCSKVLVLGDDANLTPGLLAELGLELERHSTRFGWQPGDRTSAPRFPYPLLPGREDELKGCLVIVPDYELLPDARVVGAGGGRVTLLVMEKGGRRDGLLDEHAKLEAARPDERVTVLDGAEQGRPDRVVFRVD